eukprot:jgi/Hompol1/4981/HPOL_004064-RA
MSARDSMTVLFVGRIPEGEFVNSFAFVEFEDRRDAEEALKASQEQEFELNGSKMYCEWAKSGIRRGGMGGSGERTEDCFK